MSGMDIARLNMNYFEVNDMDDILNFINTSCNRLKQHCSSIVDLKGPVISVLPFRSGVYSMKIKRGQQIRFSSNAELTSCDDLFVIDYPNIRDKLMEGEKVIIDYGKVRLKVIGFESEFEYMQRKEA